MSKEYQQRVKMWREVCEGAQREGRLTTLSHTLARLSEKAERWDALSNLIRALVENQVEGH